MILFRKIAITLDTPCRLKKSRVPKYYQDPKFSPYFDPKGLSYWWFPYPVSLQAERSWYIEIFRAECDLADIAAKVLATGTTGAANLASPDTDYILEVYYKLLNWKVSLSKHLQANSSTLPSVLIMQ
jgi:hypothetical protein